MKTKNPYFTSFNLKLILILSAIYIAVIAFSSFASGQGLTASQEPYVAVDEMPMFPGGDVALSKFFAKNVEYPKVSQENNVQGKVIVRFCVTSEGKISQISVLKGVDPLLDKEAVRVVGTIPGFSPGKKQGVPVPVWYMVQIVFKMNQQ